MARPILRSLTAVGVSSPAPMDIHAREFSLNLAVTFATPSFIVCTVEYTYDDIFSPDFDPLSALWFVHEELFDVSSNTQSNLSYPVTAVRLRVTEYDGGAVTLAAAQAGIHAGGAALDGPVSNFFPIIPPFDPSSFGFTMDFTSDVYTIGTTPVEDQGFDMDFTNDAFTIGSTV